MNHRRGIIYRSRLHWVATLFVVIAPFAYLIVFSRFTNIAAGQLGADVLTSLGRLVAAYIISVVIGWTLAVLFYSGRRAIVALPAFDVLQSFPTFALLPIAILVLGASNTTIIFFLIFTIIWPIIFSIISGLKLIKRDWHEAADVYHLRGWKYVRYFLWPASMPGVITGTIIGLGEGWEALIATANIVHASAGLGNFFESLAANIAITGFGVLGFLVLVFSINHLLWLPLLEWSHRQLEE